MLQSQPQPRPRQRPNTTHADRRFKGYKPETGRAVRSADVVEDEMLAQLKAAWKSFGVYDKLIGWIGFGRTCEDYENALELVRELKYSAEDVEKFSLALAEFQDVPSFAKKAGLFLSALINKSSDNDFVIHTNHLDEALQYLGFQNTKNIVIEGDIGYICGKVMVGGTITVRGNAGNHVGNSMKGGKIIIEGNAGVSVGHIMEGGEIHLEGGYEGITELIYGGHIFHQGKQVWPKGAN